MTGKSLFVLSLLILPACATTTAPTAKAPPSVASGLPESAHQGTDIREIQQQLANQGYYHGAVDGVWGPKSEQAVMAFQRAHDLPVTGAVDSAMLLILDPDNVYHSHGAAVPIPLPPPQR